MGDGEGELELDLNRGWPLLCDFMTLLRRALGGCAFCKGFISLDAAAVCGRCIYLLLISISSTPIQTAGVGGEAFLSLVVFFNDTNKRCV